MAREHLTKKATFQQGPERKQRDIHVAFWGKVRVFLGREKGIRKSADRIPERAERSLLIILSQSSLLTNEISLMV